MKLVKAKCPSCGADIEVDKNSDSTKCDYCGSKIIVEDAININAIEIKNLPKLEGYLKNGDREYKNYDYEEALNYYNKAIDLDPDNLLVVLRVGICKSTTTTYNKFATTYAINALKNVLKEEKDEAKAKKYITETYACIFKLEQLARNTWSSVNQYEVINITNHNERLNKCLLAYEYLFEVAKTKEFKITIVNRMINIICELLAPKKYYTFNRANGNRIVKRYNIDYNFTNILNQKYQKYVNELYTLDPSTIPTNNTNKKVSNANSKSTINIIIYVIFGILALLGLITSSYLFVLILIIDLVLYILKENKKIFVNNDKAAYITMIILGIIGIIGIFI